MTDDSFELIYFVFWRGQFQRQQWGNHVTASGVPYHLHTTRYVVSSALRGVKVLRFAQARVGGGAFFAVQ